MASTAFCLLYKLWTLRLTVKQIRGMVDTGKGHVRAIGLLYLRYVLDPKKLYEWFEPFLSDTEPVVIERGARPSTIAYVARTLLMEQKWLGTMLPRIPVPVVKDIQAKMKDRDVGGARGGGASGGGGGGRWGDDDVKPSEDFPAPPWLVGKFPGSRGKGGTSRAGGIGAAGRDEEGSYVGGGYGGMRDEFGERRDSAGEGSGGRYSEGVRERGGLGGGVGVGGWDGGRGRGYGGYGGAGYRDRDGEWGGDGYGSRGGFSGGAGRGGYGGGRGVGPRGFAYGYGFGGAGSDGREYSYEERDRRDDRDTRDYRDIRDDRRDRDTRDDRRHRDAGRSRGDRNDDERRDKDRDDLDRRDKRTRSRSPPPPRRDNEGHKEKDRDGDKTSEKGSRGEIEEGEEMED
ncbi:PRP38 pre-mRNA processing factor 38 domain-containing protein B [Gonapodya sp. JEL0774]|nr:PRP38 pre-mRNA processing factor 38 domain-containing protein B [Gonapodya sp. JEL0774]